MTGQIHSCWKIHMVGRYLLSARDCLGSGVFFCRVAQFGTRRGRSLAAPAPRVGPSSELARQQPQCSESAAEPSRGRRPSDANRDRGLLGHVAQRMGCERGFWDARSESVHSPIADPVSSHRKRCLLWRGSDGSEHTARPATRSLTEWHGA
jgi:hypothetical protein